jgi:amino acid transporter
VSRVNRRKPPEAEAAAAQARFGMFPGVFVPCVLTILGVIMFMRTGYVTASVGVWLALLILALSKLITFSTALSLSAVASNLKMRGGGVYFMISRVLGPDFGGSIGITLYLAQATSVAFYVIGFTEALFATLAPLLSLIEIWGMDGNQLVLAFYVQPIISSVVVIGLFALTFKGADIAIKAQYVVLVVLMLAVTSFLVGGALKFDTATFQAATPPVWSDFWVAFAIFFPAATGITAGANMSGDLKNPARTIPWGTLLAIVFTMGVYVAQILLMAGSTAKQDLLVDPFISLQNMAGWFWPLVLLGVFAATLSSALSSFLGAPRILQAMGEDRLMNILVFFGKGSGPTNEPRRATVITFVFAICVIWAGDLNAVAEVISMFFLIAYGMINLSAFVESKAGNPSFRPTFRFFHWTTGLVGAVACGVAMVKINDTYALIAVAIVAVIYFYFRKQDIETSYGDAKRGFIFQRTRDNLFYLEEARAHPKNWRPILVTVSDNPVKQAQLVRVGSWLESRRGLYSVVHIAERPDDDLGAKVRYREARREDLRRQTEAEGIVAFSEALVVDDFHQGLADFLQSYSLGGLRPNTVLTAMPLAETAEARQRFLRTVGIIAAFDLNLVILKPGDMSPQKRRRTIDLWWRGKKNGSLMALFAYLMTLDRTWSGAKVRLLRVVHDDAEERESRRLLEELRGHSRMAAEIELIRSEGPSHEVIAATSGPTADLVMLGLNASDAAEVLRSLEKLEPLLKELPTTVLVSSNGEANVFV